MANTVAVSNCSVGLLDGVVVDPTEAPAYHKVITFPGMTGCEVIPGAIEYSSYSIRGFVSGASVATCYANIATLALAVAALVGRQADTVTITYADGSSTSLTYVRVDSGVTKTGKEAKLIGGNYQAEVQFAVRRCQ